MSPASAQPAKQAKEDGSAICCALQQSRRRLYFFQPVHKGMTVIYDVIINRGKKTGSIILFVSMKHKVKTKKHLQDKDSQTLP